MGSSLFTDMPCPWGVGRGQNVGLRDFAIFCLWFFRPIEKTKWPSWLLIGWDIFDFSSETTEGNLTKLDRKKDLSVLYQVCVFRANRKNKMATLASDWLRHFRLLLWNRWREFNKTWQEERSQCPLPSLCFSGQSEKQDGCPGQSVKKVAHCTQVNDMWPFGPLVVNCFLLIVFADRNVEMRNYFLKDNSVKFEVIPYIDLRRHTCKW